MKDWTKWVVGAAAVFLGFQVVRLLQKPEPEQVPAPDPLPGTNTNVNQELQVGTPGPPLPGLTAHSVVQCITQPCPHSGHWMDELGNMYDSTGKWISGPQKPPKPGLAPVPGSNGNFWQDKDQKRYTNQGDPVIR